MAHKTKSTYLIIRGKWYHYKRRVPSDCRDFFPHEYVQAPLNTDSESIAKNRSKEFSEMLEDYWCECLNEGADMTLERFNKSVKLLRLRGFKYRPYPEVITGSSTDFANRVLSANVSPALKDKKIIMGVTKKPDVLIADMFEGIYKHALFSLVGKTDNEIRKWKNPRKKAIINFNTVIGNKSIEAVTRTDILDFRSWWVDRIIHEGLTANSANKDFGYIKKAMRVTSDNNMSDLNIEGLFKDITLKEDIKKQRHPFPISHIENVLFTHKYKNLSEELRLFIFAMADTGCRVSELTGLDESSGDVVLNAEVPHIKIRKNKFRGIKNKPSERDIPLVGSSLYAFQELARINNGAGFKEYLGRADALSAALNKYMAHNNLLYKENTTLYSLRHSFEDRLQSVEPPEKLHCSIFGHKYDREKYGDGPNLEQKQEYMQKIAFNI